MKRESLGTDGRGNNVELITLSNANGTEVGISTLGATVVSFVFRDKKGEMRDIVLGYDNPADYLANTHCFGATIGRNANRIANAELTLNGRAYALEANSNTNNLHSGSNGVHRKIWEIERMDEAENRVVLNVFSADLEQGFPGNMTIKVTFRLTEADALHIFYEASADQDTVANFTNHSYFNLAGHDQGYIGSQKLKIYADEFTPLLPNEPVPTGEIRPVKGTPLDFTEFKEIGRDIQSEYSQLVYNRGFDQNFVLHNQGKLELMAEAICGETGIHLYAYTDCPGVQLYTANFVSEHQGKNGAVYAERHAFCLEAQYFPDAFHHAGFPKPLLKAGDIYTSETIYKLGLD